MVAGRASIIGFGLLCACAEPSGIDDAAGDTTSTPAGSSADGSSADGSSADGSESSGGMLPPTTADGSTSDAMGSTGSDADSGGSDSEATTGGPTSGVFGTGTFTIPAGATVEEFSFTSTLDFNPGVLDGSTFLVVTVTDISHPERNQDELCTTSHPLDGCATVDYGAFGNTHDNRVSFQGADGPIVAHLWKDRSLLPDTEPLLDSE